MIKKKRYPKNPIPPFSAGFSGSFGLSGFGLGSSLGLFGEVVEQAVSEDQLNDIFAGSADVSSFGFESFAEASHTNVTETDGITSFVFGALGAGVYESTNCFFSFKLAFGASFEKDLI